MINRISKLLLGFVFMILFSLPASAETMMLEYDGNIHEYNGAVYSLVVNNNIINPSLSPIIFNDRALVPVREIFEEVGATVEYDSSDKSVTIYNEDTTVVLYINDNIAYINGRKVMIPDNVVPKLITKLGGETKTMVPVRFISESIGMPVDFDAEAGVILIASDKNSVQLPPQNTENKQEETLKPIVEKTVFESVSYETLSSTRFALYINTNKKVKSIADFTLEAPGRLVIDLNETVLGLHTDELYINSSGITSVRFGDNGERSRIVIDSEYIKNYNVEYESDTRIVVNVRTSIPDDSLSATPTPTKAPTITPSNPTVTTPTPTPRPIIGNEVAKRIVVLDAGHGGADSGAVGKLGGEEEKKDSTDGTENTESEEKEDPNVIKIYEKDLTLAITKKVKAILENNGIAVSMTRTGDTLPTLVERPTQANNIDAALFVSIHINSVDGNSDANGIETFYASENNYNMYGTTSEVFAKSLLKNMIAKTGATNRGVKVASHAVTKRCNMPASLVECGFISNQKELNLMLTEDYQNKLAQGIAQGIIDTLPLVRTK